MPPALLINAYCPKSQQHECQRPPPATAPIAGRGEPTLDGVLLLAVPTLIARGEAEGLRPVQGESAIHKGLAVRKGPPKQARSAIGSVTGRVVAERGTRSSSSAKYISPTSRKILDDTTRLLAKALKRLADK